MVGLGLGEILVLLTVLGGLGVMPEPLRTTALVATRTVVPLSVVYREAPPPPPAVAAPAAPPPVTAPTRPPCARPRRRFRAKLCPL